MNICIIGGGNISHAMTVKFSQQSDYKVSILTRSPEKWNKHFIGQTLNGNEITANINIISNNPKDVVSNADLILIAVPKFAVKDILININKFLRNGQALGCVPGSGGFEFLCEKYIDKKVILFGMERVPYISRVLSYGERVKILGDKKLLKVAFINGKDSKKNKIINTLENAFSKPIKILDSYLLITISNSNPILHPSRLYSLFYQYHPNLTYDKNYYFYKEWDNLASKILIKCDEELKEAFSKTPFEREYTTILEHYESYDENSLTMKINNIDAFKEILSPMKEVDEKVFIPDFKSRYFTEDIPYGLSINRTFCHDLGVPSPTIDMVLDWAAKYVNVSETDFDFKSYYNL